MAGERLPARFSLRSQLWFLGTGKCFETATSHMQTVVRHYHNNSFMNGIQLIQEKGKQPVAVISNEDLDFLIGREFPSERDFVKAELDKVTSDSEGGKNRISACVLKLAERDSTKIDSLIRLANEDSRDVISRAEYPRASLVGFDLFEQDGDATRNVFMEDWKEYSTWLKNE